MREPLWRRVLGRFRRALAIAALGPSLAQRVRLFVVFWEYWLTDKSSRMRSGSRPRGVCVSCHGGDISLTVWTYTDLEVLKEIFVDKEYALPPRLKPRTIVDLGSNIGISLLYFRALYPDAWLYGFEPDPVAYSRLQINLAGDSKVELLPLAIGAKDGERDFFATPESWTSSVFPTASARKLRVAGRTLSSVCKDLAITKVDLLKVDVEGAEWEILTPPDPGLAGVEAATGELHFPGPVEDAEATLRRAFSRHSVSIVSGPDPSRAVFQAVRRED